MNTKAKRRLMVVTIAIVAMMAVILAVVGGSSAAKTVTLSEAVDGDLVGKRIEVSGSVVDNSFSVKDGILTFEIYDENSDAGQTLTVSYDGSASATFGNGVMAICTGMLGEESGKLVLTATELVTKCPSKYENATEALSVQRLLDYGESIIDKPVKTVGTVKAGTLTAAGTSDERFVLVDSENSAIEVPVEFLGALPEGIVDGTSVVVTGSLSSAGTIISTDVAQEA